VVEFHGAIILAGLGHAVRQLGCPRLGLLDLAAFSATVCSMDRKIFDLIFGVAGSTMKTKSY